MGNRTMHSLKTLWSMFYFHGLWIVLLSFAAQIFSQYQASLFGYTPSEPMLAAMAFSPKLAFRELGISLLTYSLVHESWTHWAVSCLIFFYFSLRISLTLRPRIKSYLWHLRAFFIYGALSVLVALTYLLPFAPTAILQDRVLGLSAIIFMQLGFLLSLRSYYQTAIIAIALFFSYYYVGFGTSLTTWGHSSGFMIGLIYGIILRLRSRKAS